METAEQIFYVSVALIILCVLGIVQWYAAPDVSWHVKLDTSFALVTSLSIVALVPWDVFTTLNDNSTRVIVVLWTVTYWTTQGLTWLVLPMHQIYADAGDFTALARLKRALKENLMFYTVLLVLLVVLVILLLIFEGMTMSGLLQSSIALANAFGLATGVFLLGYGLVDIPRMLWKSASASVMLRECEQKVGATAEALNDAHADMSSMVLIVQQTSTAMPRRHELRWAMDVIDQESNEMVPMRICSTNVSDFDDMMDINIDYDELDGLANLRRSLKRAITVYIRTKRQYEIAVLEAFEYEDIVHNQSKLSAPGGGWQFRRMGSTAGSGCWAVTVEIWTYLWKCCISPVMLRVLGAISLLFSLAIILAESTIWLPAFTNVKDQRNELSVFSQLLSLLRTDDADPVLVQVMVMLPLTYICTCTYYSLFKLGIFKFYTLTAHSSDAFSLLLSGALVCRYSAPLCYNFLSLIPVVHEEGRETVFESKLGTSMSAGGVWAIFNRWFPVILPIYCLCIVFHLFHRVVAMCKCFGWICSCCCKPKNMEELSFDGDDSECLEVVDKGREIIKRERANKQAGSPIGEGLDTPSVSAGLLANERFDRSASREPTSRTGREYNSRTSSIAEKYRKYGSSTSSRSSSAFERSDAETGYSAGRIHSERAQSMDRNNDRWEASKERLSHAMGTTSESAQRAKRGRGGGMSSLFGGLTGGPSRSSGRGEDPGEDDTANGSSSSAGGRGGLEDFFSRISN